MTGRKAVEREVVMETELKIDEGYVYEVTATKEGNLQVLRYKKAKYEKKPVKTKETSEPAKEATPTPPKA